MLKNIHPAITGTLLDALRNIAPGSWLALTNDAPTAARTTGTIIPLDMDFEPAAEAILSVLPIHADDDAPVRFWLQNPADEDNWDAVFAVTGIVRDGERRAVMSAQVSADVARDAVADAAVVVHVPDVGPDTTFLLRVGGEPATKPEGVTALCPAQA